jgi:hypothetical protein
MDDILAEALAPDESQQSDSASVAEQPDMGDEQQPAVETEEAQAQEEQKPVAKPSIDNDETFADDALQTPEQLRAARELIQEQRKTSHRKYLELQKRELRFKKDKGDVLQLRDNLRAQYGALQNDIQALRNGDPDTVLGALSRLTGGKNATELFQEISINLARAGKKAEVSPEVATLKGELEELRGYLRKQQEGEQQRQLQAQIAEEKRHIIKEVSDETRFPVLASFAAENAQGVADDVAQYIVTQHESGNQLDLATALRNIESQLQARFQRIQPKLAPTIGESGRETGAVANPGAPQVGKTLTPSLATQSSGMSREPSDEERLRKTANELPQDFWAQFGM